MKVLLSTAMLALVVYQSAWAQHVREQDITFRTTIVRGIDLTNTVNQQVFGKNALMSKILIESALKEKFPVYNPDTLENQLSLEEFVERISFPNDSNQLERYRPEQLYEVELMEELIFDKHRSEFIYLPKFITLFIPVEINYRAIMEPIASWKYEDCQALFKNDKRAFSDAIGFGKAKVNFNESLLLRTYNSQIVKIGNPDDLYFDQQFADPLQAFFARKEEEGKIQELVYKVFHP